LSLGNFAENELLDALLATGSYVAAASYVSLHTADPGETGADEVTGGSYARQSCSWNAASGGSADNSSALSFTGMPAATVSHFGVWDASSVGNFIVGGALSQSESVGAGQTVTVAAGALTVSLD
jgi:hypothetical protein